MPTYFPNLPTAIPAQPVSAFIRGGKEGTEFFRGQQEMQYGKMALEREQERQAGLKEYGQTGDLEQLKQKTDPLFAAQVEANLLKLDSAKRDEVVKRLSTATDLADKAMPYIAAAAKTNPQQAAKMWPEMIKDIEASGIKIPDHMKNFTVENFLQLQKHADDLKTAVARINAMARMGAVERKGELDLEREGVKHGYKMTEIEHREAVKPKDATGGKITPARQFEMDYADENKERAKKGLPPISRQEYRVDRARREAQAKAEGRAAGKPETPEARMKRQMMEKLEQKKKAKEADAAVEAMPPGPQKDALKKQLEEAKRAAGIK